MARVKRDSCSVAAVSSSRSFSTQDWRGWRHERGLYFPGKYDSKYQELLDCGDPGEVPLRSGLLFAEYGKGSYLYSSLALYRQVRELHPGALRLFVNMISVPRYSNR